MDNGHRLQEMNKVLENFTKESGFTKRVADYSCTQLYYWTWVTHKKLQMEQQVTLEKLRTREHRWVKASKIASQTHGRTRLIPPLRFLNDLAPNMGKKMDFNRQKSRWWAAAVQVRWWEKSGHSSAQPGGKQTHTRNTNKRHKRTGDRQVGALTV